MNEARRLAYLRAMGIDCYVRRDLRAVVSGPADASTSGPTMVAPGYSPVNTLAGSHPRAAMSDFNTRPWAAAGPSVPETDFRVAEADSETEVEQLRFSLHFYPISAHLAVISEIPFAGNERIQKGTKRLLAAILRALDTAVAELPNPDRFNWPLAADDDASAVRAAEAYQALGGFLRKRLEKQEFRVMLVFGDRCRSWFSEAGIESLVEAAETRVVHTHSLGAMMQVPALKQIVWQDVRAVSEQLSDQ